MGMHIQFDMHVCLYSCGDGQMVLVIPVEFWEQLYTATFEHTAQTCQFLYTHCTCVIYRKATFLCTWKNYANWSKQASWQIYVIFIYASKRSMYCDVWRDKHLCKTNLCDRRLTRIIQIIKLVQKSVPLRYYACTPVPPYMIWCMTSQLTPSLYLRLSASHPLFHDHPPIRHRVSEHTCMHRYLHTLTYHNYTACAHAQQGIKQSVCMSVCLSSAQKSPDLDI
jgi:hypothetical protein